MAGMEADPFDDVLGLEDQFYNEGYQQGITDGAKAGKIEGRLFGLEKGFEKFVEAGKLHGRSVIWGARLAQDGNQSSPVVREFSGGEADLQSLPQLSKNPRLSKHVRSVYALAEPDTLSTANSEDAASDFDDRLKRANGKVKLIEKLLGEEGHADGASGSGQLHSGNNIEEVDMLKARK